jgi:hypothetical protein
MPIARPVRLRKIRRPKRQVVTAARLTGDLPLDQAAEAILAAAEGAASHLAAVAVATLLAVEAEASRLAAVAEASHLAVVAVASRLAEAAVSLEEEDRRTEEMEAATHPEVDRQGIRLVAEASALDPHRDRPTAAAAVRPADLQATMTSPSSILLKVASADPMIPSGQT